MSEMILRAAKAIQDSVTSSGGLDSVKAARAVFEAIREPTREMQMSGALSIPDHDPGIDGAVACWNSMIDTALKD